MTKFKMHIIQQPEDGHQALVMSPGVKIVRPKVNPVDDAGRVYPDWAFRRISARNDTVVVAWAFSDSTYANPLKPPFADIVRYHVEWYEESVADLVTSFPKFSVEWAIASPTNNGKPSAFNVRGSIIELRDRFVGALEGPPVSRGPMDSVYAGVVWQTSASTNKWVLSDSQVRTLKIRDSRVLMDAINAERNLSPIVDPADQAENVPQTTDVLLGRLAASQQLIDTTREEMDWIVQEARDNGITWAAIGETLGIRGETAYNKFSAAGRESHRKNAAKARAATRTNVTDADSK